MSLESISPQALRHYVQSHHEKAYLLVDVRQPDEYRQSHIPGARLMPLPQLAQRLDELSADKELVFYCHSGGRSMAAAVMLEEQGHAGPIYNLTGGMLAWDGGRLADFPRVALFKGQTAQEMFRTAINLEKGAQLFYEAVGRDFDGRTWSDTFVRLAKAEVAHAQTIHGFLKEIEPAVASFESVYGNADGDVLEGGMTLAQAMERLVPTQDESCIRLVEMALQIEYAAFDLYRTLADQTGAVQRPQAFIQLAQAEKAHMQALITALDQCE
ncbi:MAG: sulfurtransferase [Desulfatitalea sp.]|nr:hypothetical protein [Desulfatitalea sp.]NNK01813.1 sulfurtransferase [Desulfatitalea sp.]